jgi:hypothetical protein
LQVSFHIVEDPMNTFRKTTPTKSVMFVVTYDDARTAYLWVDSMRAGGDQAVAPIARAQQEQGTLPEGNITSIKRVR